MESRDTNTRYKYSTSNKTAYYRSKALGQKQRFKFTITGQQGYCGRMWERGSESYSQVQHMLLTAEVNHIYTIYYIRIKGKAGSQRSSVLNLSELHPMFLFQYNNRRQE